MAALAHVAQKPINTLDELASQVTTILEASAVCSQGALFRMDGQWSVLTAWGMPFADAEAMVSRTGRSVTLPDGWRSAEMGNSEIPGLVALKVAPEYADVARDVVVAVGAHVALVWQNVVADLLQQSQKELEALIQSLSQVSTLEGLRELVADSLTRSWHIRIAEVKADLTLFDQPTLTLRQNDTIIRQASNEPQPLPRRHASWVPDEPGMMLQVGSADDPAAVVTITGKFAELPALQPVIQIVLRSVATAYERLNLAQSLQRREQVLKALTETLQSVSQEVNLEVLLQKILERASDLLGTAGGGIFMYDEATERLVIRYIHRFPLKYRDQRLKLGSGVVGRVAQTLQSSFVNNYHAASENLNLPEDVPISALIAAPLRDQHTLIGVLALAHIDQQRVFTPADRELLETFATQAALAIRTARLIDAQSKQSRELFVLYENSRTVNASLDYHQIFDHLADNIQLALGCDQVSAWAYDAKQRRFEVIAVASDDALSIADTLQHSGEYVDEDTSTLLHTLVETQQPLVVSDVQHYTELGSDQRTLLEQGVRSVLAVPLLSQDEFVGAVVAYVYTNQRTWLPSETTLVQTLTVQAAVAIGNAHLLREERRRSVELSLLQDLSSRLNAVISLPAMLEVIATGLHQILPTVEIEICLYDPQAETLTSQYATQLVQRHFIREPDKEYDLDQGFSGWLARHRVPLRIGNIYEQRAVEPVNPASEYVLQSYLGVPLLAGDELIGTLELAAEKAHHFGAEDERLVTIIAAQVAQAIRNVRRYEATDEILRERVRELTALQRISRELTSTLRLEQLLPAMLNEIVQATGCAHGLVALNNEHDPHSFEIVSALGYPDDLDLQAQVEPLLTKGLLADSLNNPDALIIDDTTVLEASIEWPGVQSLMITPILYENRVAGVIVATDEKPRAFDHAALDFVRSVSDQAALAIGNSQHFAEQVRQRELLQQRAGLLNEVLEIGNALRADMELDVLLEQIAFSVSEAAGFRVVLFSLLDEEDPDYLRTVSGAGLALTELEERRNQPFEIAAVMQLLDPDYRIGRAYFIAQTSADEQETWHAGDQLLVPMYNTSRELIGIMFVDDPFSHERPTRRTVETLEIFANQAAIAIENAALFEQRSRQIAELNAINQVSRAATSSLDFPSLARQVYNVLKEMLPIDSYYLVVFNDAIDAVIASFGIDKEEVSVDVNLGPVNRDSLMGWIARHRQPLLFQDLPEETQQYPGMKWQKLGQASARSWIGMPLITGEGAIRGVLSIQNVERGRYTDHDVEILQTIANQLAVAVENSRLYGDAQQRLQEMALVNRIGSLTSSTLNMEDILREVYNALADVLPVDAYHSFIYDPKHQDTMLQVDVDEGVFYIKDEREPLLSRSPSEWIVTHNTPLLFHNMPEETKNRFKVKRFGNLTRRVQSWVGVPLRISANESIGLISIQHYDVGKYSERDVSLLQTVSSQVSLAVQNAHLFNEREQQIRELNAIGHIGQLMSASFALDEMLKRTAEYLQQVTNAPIFFTLVYDPQKNLVTRSFAIQEGVFAETSSQGTAPRPGSLSEWVLKHRAPLVIDDTNDAAALAQKELVPISNPVEGKVKGPRSWVGVPILAQNGEPIGILSLQDYRIGAFDDSVIAFLSNVSSHVSLGLQKVQLFQERDRQIRELETMRRIGQVTSSTLDMNEMMHNVYQVLTESLPVEGFFINIYDSQIDRLIYSLLIDRDGPIAVPPVRPVKPRSLTDWILRNRQPLLFNSLSEELPAYVDLEPLQHGSGPMAQSWMGVPLMAKNEQPIGVLALQHYQPNQFSTQDLHFLGNIAYQVTLGVQNVRLYEQTEQSLQQLGAEAERLALINHVSNLTASTLDPQVLYSLAVEEMSHATGADQARLVLFDYEAGIGFTRAEFPEGDLTLQVPLTNNATIPWMQQHRRPLIINDIETNPLVDSFKTTLLELGVRRLMLVPLIVKGDLIGSVGIDTLDETKSFTPRDAETCQTIANQVAQALENARLFAETERQATALSSKVGELSVLLEAGQALSSLREPNQVLNTLVRLVARQLQVDTVLLTTRTPDNVLIPAASLGVPKEFTTNLRVEIGSGLIGSVASSAQPLTIRDVRSQPNESTYPEFNREHHLRSFLGVPVRYRDEVIGVLSVMTRVEREFTPDEIALLGALADQAAIALENARLFAGREQQIVMLQALNDVTQSITSTLDVQQMLQELHTQLGKVVDTQFSFIALYDDEHNLLSFPVLIEHHRRIKRDPLPLAEGVLSQVVRQRKTLVLNNQEETAQSSRIILGQDLDMASWVGVPIISGEHVLGVINIQSPVAGMFTPDIVQFLQSVASQVSIALENARLFGEREQQIIEAEILAKIGQSVTATLSADALASSLLEGLQPVFDVSNAFIALYDAPTNTVTTIFGYVQGEEFHAAAHILQDDFLKLMFFEQHSLRIHAAAEIAVLPVIPDVQLVTPQSLLAAPITMGSQTAGMHMNQPLGALVILSEQIHAFSAADERFLTSVANQSSIAVQKAMLFSERERRIRELDTLNRISQVITSTINLDEILARLHDGLNEIIDMSTSFIGLYDERANIMHYEQTYDQGKSIEFQSATLGTNINSWVIEHRQPLLLSEAEEADEYRSEAARDRNLQRRVGSDTRIEQSFLVVPIIVGNTVLGVINIQSYEKNAFSEYDMSFVSTVAAQAAASIANARLFEGRERSIQQLRILSTIGQALGSTVRFEDLLRVIYEQASQLVNTTNFYLALYDERRDEISFPLFIEHGQSIEVEPQRNGGGLTEYVVKTRQPLVLHGDIHEKLTTLGVDVVGEMAHSWVGIPMIASDKVVGVMSIQDYALDNAYNDDDVQLLSTVANQAAQALENARLFSESRESVRELSTLSETSVSLASTLDIEELLAISASSAIEMARANYGGVLVIDPETNTITHSLILDTYRSELEAPISSADLTGFKLLRPLREGQSVTIYDALVDEALASFSRDLGIRGVVFLPMLREGLRGVVFVGMQFPYTFEDRSIASLQILTTQIGQAVNNAQLFDQIRRFNMELEQIVAQRTQALADANTELVTEKERVEALYNIATELNTTLDRSELLLRTLDLSSQALNVRRGSVLMLDRESRQLMAQAVLNEEMGLQALETPVQINRDQGLANWILTNSEGVIIDDTLHDDRWVVLEHGRGDDIRSVIAVPLFSSDQAQGVLMLYNTQPKFFKPEHLRFLSTIAGEVSSALHNADLYHLVYESADRLSDAMWQQREEASRTSAILQSVSEGVMVIDQDTQKITLFNPAAEEVLRVPRAHVFGEGLQAFAQHAAEEDTTEEGRALELYTRLNEGVQMVQQTDAVHTSIIELPGQPGQIIAANFAAVIGEGYMKFGVVVVVRDITREVEADRAKRDFIATVSHELRTPLTPIRGFVDLLMLGAVGELSETQREMLNTIKNNTMRMVSLVEDLLEIGRLEAGKITLNTAPANMNQLVRDTVGMWNLELEKKEMTLILELDETLSMVEYDTKRVGQVLTNLVSNAIKYTYTGGTVTIRTFRNAEDLIQIDVQDTGVGLTPDQQKNLFKRFYRADSPLRDEVGGTGLGLSIAKSFIELHNGDMWVQSVYGEGSTFSFALPEKQPKPDLGPDDEQEIASLPTFEETSS